MNEIDYDLRACLEYNPQDGFTVDDIDSVLAVWEGQNEGDDWRWVLKLKDGRFVFLQGGCDYTGWDCQSWATHEFTDSAENAAHFALGDVSIDAEHHPSNAGMRHMLNILSGEYMANSGDVYKSLMEQIANGKNETWREKTDRDFGVQS